MTMNPWRGLEGLPRDVWILFTTILVNRAGTMALPFLVLYLTKQLHIGPERAGLALLAYGLGSLLTAPVAGRLSDSIGARRVMMFSLFLSGSVLLFFPALRSFRSILATTLLWSVTSEAFRPASFSILSHAVPAARRKAAFAVARLAVNLGMGIGPLVGGFLVRVSYPALFLVDGLTSILAGLVLVLWLGHPKEEAEHGVVRAGSSSSWIPEPRVLFFLFALLPVAMVFFQLHGAFALFLVHGLALPESAFGLLLSVNTTLIIFLEVPLNLATSQWSHRRTLTLGAILVGAGFGMLTLATGFWTAALTVVVWTFGEMILLPGSTAYMAELAPPERRGTYMGYYQMTFAFALSFGASAGTGLLERLGAVPFWSLAFLCGALSATLMARVHEPAREPSPARAAQESA